MNYIGIDIAKKTFVAAFPNEKGFKVKSFPNNVDGIRDFIKGLDPERDRCVMEATGNYCFLLLYLLEKKGVSACMVNPKQTKHFARMMMEVTKTDAKDACMIAMYGQKMEPPVYKIPTESIMRLKQKRTVIRQLRKQYTALSNLKESLSVMPNMDKSCEKSITKTMEFIGKQLVKLEDEMAELTNVEYQKQMELLTSIRGIGPACAAALIIATSGFTCFDNAKQVSRYFGLCPTYQQSGTSIHVRGGISHMGDSQIRGALYMASMSAIRTNTSCKEFFYKLRKNGKPGKLALTAVSNKLIRQAFAVVKSGVPYIDGYVSPNPMTTQERMLN